MTLDKLLKELENNNSINSHQLDIFLSWLEEGNFVDTGKKFNISRQRVYQIVTGVQKKIKKKLGIN